MNTILAQITQALTNIKGNQFVSLQYLTKSSGELARHTINVGFSYIKLVEKSITELEIIINDESHNWSDLQKTAADELMASLKESLQAHANGQQNHNYTKKGQYIPIGNGVNLNTTDNTIQLFGLSHTKTVFIEGTHKQVNSKPLTIVKKQLRNRLSVSKFKEFALDVNNIQIVKVDGNVLVLD